MNTGAQKKRWRLPFHILWRKRTCVDCGFLASSNDETSLAERCMLATKGSSAQMPQMEPLRCYRSRWARYDLNICDKLDEVTERRHCEYYLSYEPGLSPEGHMNRLLQSKEKRAQLWYTLLAAFLGSALTLLVQWAAKHF